MFKKKDKVAMVIGMSKNIPALSETMSVNLNIMEDDTKEQMVSKLEKAWECFGERVDYGNKFVRYQTLEEELGDGAVDEIAKLREAALSKKYAEEKKGK